MLHLAGQFGEIAHGLDEHLRFDATPWNRTPFKPRERGKLRGLGIKRQFDAVFPQRLHKVQLMTEPRGVKNCPAGGCPSLCIEACDLAVMHLPNPQKKVERRGGAPCSRKEDNIAHGTHVAFYFHDYEPVKTKYDRAHFYR